MKLWILTFLTVMTFLAALALPTQCLAQKNTAKLPHYTVQDLGTLGGTYSEGDGISNRGWVEGSATLQGDIYEQAFLWRNGGMTDLGTLGGLNSFAYGRGVNDRGNAVGGAENSTTDPLAENWCGFGTGLECVPFFWRSDIQKMIPLPTLGGNNGVASAINYFDEVAGQAENATIDTTCSGTFLQIEAVIWINGRAKELPPFRGDPDGAAFAINDWGQAVGTSNNCTSAIHALLWQNGKAIDLGNLGGAMGNEGYGINDLSQVVGKSDLRGDTTQHAFLWQWGVMTDLGTLPGDVMSRANGINNQGQVAGWSIDAYGDARAFLWQNGVMTDLNTLIPTNSPLYLLTADSINDEGQIVGIAWQWSTSEEHGFLATPSDGEGVGESVTTAATQRPNITLPENVRNLLRQRFGGFKGGMVTR